MNRIKVVIDNVVYELSSGESVEYIQTVSNYIDRKIKSIYSVKSEGSINPSLRTLFISLNIADDLFKERDKVKELEREAAGLRKEIAELKAQNEKLAKGQGTAKTEPKVEVNTESDKLKAEQDKAKTEQDKPKPAYKPVHKPNPPQTKSQRSQNTTNTRPPQNNESIGEQTRLEETTQKSPQVVPFEVPKERT